jgi:hypothetical protein
MGRDVIGGMNGREFALFVAFWWTVLAATLNMTLGIVRRVRGSTKPRGFDVIRDGGGASTGEQGRERN